MMTVNDQGWTDLNLTTRRRAGEDTDTQTALHHDG